jgi:hypothetical protein
LNATVASRDGARYATAADGAPDQEIDAGIRSAIAEAVLAQRKET